MPHAPNIILFSVICSLLGVLSCVEIAEPPRPKAAIIVHVSFGDMAIAGKSVELVETHTTKVTDNNGYVRFEVLPGKYTIRVHDVNGPGPALQQYDVPVDVKDSETHTIEVFDCLLCV